MQGSPLLQNSPQDCFAIHPMRSARGKGISLTAVSDKGSALDPQPFFTRKGLTEKPVLSLAGFKSLIGLFVAAVSHKAFEDYCCGDGIDHRFPRFAADIGGIEDIMRCDGG